MTDTQRTAQELADECKRLAYEHADWMAAHAVDFGYQGDEDVPDYGGCPEVLTNRGALHAAIDRLAALASQAEPAKGRLISSGPNAGRAVPPAAPAQAEPVGLLKDGKVIPTNSYSIASQAEQSEDGRDADLVSRIVSFMREQACGGSNFNRIAEQLANAVEIKFCRTKERT